MADGAIAAAFDHLENLVVIELETPESRSKWRRMILAARQFGAEQLPQVGYQPEQEQ